MRKPNYGFERAQRAKAKEDKAAAKALRKQERALSQESTSADGGAETTAAQDTEHQPPRGTDG